MTVSESLINGLEIGKTMTKIIRNRAQCLLCGDIIESRSRHDFVTCTCGALSVDGGHSYIRRAFINQEDYEELSELEKDDEGA